MKEKTYTTQNGWRALDVKPNIIYQKKWYMDFINKFDVIKQKWSHFQALWKESKSQTRRKYL